MKKEIILTTGANQYRTLVENYDKLYSFVALMQDNNDETKNTEDKKEKDFFDLSILNDSFSKLLEFGNLVKKLNTKITTVQFAELLNAYGNSAQAITDVLADIPYLLAEQLINHSSYSSLRTVFEALDKNTITLVGDLLFIAKDEEEFDKELKEIMRLPIYEDSKYVLSLLGVEEPKNIVPQYDVVHSDTRGQHEKFFVNGVNKKFNNVQEIFMTTNNKYTLRGLHRQVEHDQQKVIKAVNGSFNVRVIKPKDVDYAGEPENYSFKNNLDDGSIVYGFEDYNAKSDFTIFVPKGYLLGYVALENNSKMLYIADNEFVAENDETFNAFDPRFNIDWGLNENAEINMSEKDKHAPYYENN